MHLTDELKLTGGEPSAQRGPMAWWPSTLMMLIGPSTKTHGNTSNNANTCQPCQMRGLLSGVPQHPRDKIWKSWNAHLLVASEFKNKNYSQILVQTPAVLQNPMFFFLLKSFVFVAHWKNKYQKPERNTSWTDPQTMVFPRCRSDQHLAVAY